MKIKLCYFDDRLKLRVQETPESYEYQVFRLEKEGLYLSHGVVVDSLTTTPNDRWNGSRIAVEE